MEIPIVRKRNDRDGSEMVRDVAELMRALKWLFEFSEWQINVELSPSSARSIPAQVYIQPEYFTADLTLFEEQLADLDELSFWEIIFHEFAHILLCEYIPVADQFMETLSTDTERRLLKGLVKLADERSAQRLILSWIRCSPKSVKNLKELARSVVARFRAAD